MTATERRQRQTYHRCPQLSQPCDRLTAWCPFPLPSFPLRFLPDINFMLPFILLAHFFVATFSGCPISVAHFSVPFFQMPFLTLPLLQLPIFLVDIISIAPFLLRYFWHLFFVAPFPTLSFFVAKFYDCPIFRCLLSTAILPCIVIQGYKACSIMPTLFIILASLPCSSSMNP